MRRCILVALSSLSAAAFAAAVAPAASAHVAAFYLALRPGQCALAPLTSKTVRVVPCAKPTHAFEVFATGHGGWGNHPTPAATAHAIAGSVCKAKFAQRTGHPIARPYGWYAFWPDQGAEQNRYGDRIICGLVLFPHIGPIGAGSHIH